ncbi:divergent polysaccharide deacetylase family protein [Jannaschia ovalis]|uniref:Divergent polysaccharide deacetylase family protein n=1 Tax=Jannaschia ovalis TaxID=3038773 RepID=A0ABY8LB64_9RHOB|nr:divergent polysaccharide deacetylase family protein [Jannaschia sp. GRR-S6-38]WGH78516.1 divergent polysaccharide deacetylase family protein [Jannaschia sp. GRR-S6-38]
MLKGVLLGSVSALGLGAVLLAGVSLLVPGPAPQRATAPPQQPILRDQAEAPPAQPDRPAAAPVATGAERTAATTAGSVADAVELPAGSEFNRPPEDGPLELGAPEAPGRPDPLAAGLPPAGSAPSAAPRPDTQSATQPETGSVAALVAPPEDGDAPALPQTPQDAPPQTFRAVEPEAAPVDETSEAELASAVETTPAEPAAPEIEPEEAPAEAAPVAAEETAAPPAPEASATAEAPEAAPAPMESVATPLAPAPDAAAPGTGRAGIRVVPEAEIVDAPPAPEAEPEAAVAADTSAADDGPRQMPRRIVLDSERDAANVLDRVTAPAPDASEPGAAVPGALSRFAADFDNPEGLPLLGVVLVDDGAGAVDRDSLTGFDFPVTFAVDATDPAAAQAAAAYRAAGQEVMLLADALAPAGDARDVEVALVGAQGAVPEALAVLDIERGGFADNRAALDALLRALAGDGMGFVARPGGLGSEVDAAERAGVPAIQLYRVLDGRDERASVITRYLDRAAFEATQGGSVLVVGRATPEMVTALYSWRLGGRSDEVAIAPVSAILTGRAGPNGEAG